MIGTEVAVMHGVARVQVKGHQERRQRELASARSIRPARPNDGSWALQLARDFGQPDMARFGDLVSAGPSPDGPMTGRPPH